MGTAESAAKSDAVTGRTGRGREGCAESDAVTGRADSGREGCAKSDAVPEERGEGEAGGVIFMFPRGRCVQTLVARAPRVVHRTRQASG
jgi:hypothetical protein